MAIITLSKSVVSGSSPDAPAMSIGLKRGKVKLVPHDPNWNKLFHDEKINLINAFPDLILEVSHGGSTTIPTISAKPIIDMFIRINHLPDAERIKERMTTLGYSYRGEDGVPGRILYAKGPEDNRTHYAHFVQGDNDEWKNHLLIKEYFLKHPKTAAEYEELKLSLAGKFPNNRNAYSKGKDAFIKDIIAKSKLDKF